MCDKCQIVGHFKKMCKTKLKSGKVSKRNQKINQVLTQDIVSDSSSEGTDSDDVQQVYANGSGLDKTTCFKTEWIIDSGAHVNVITRGTWKSLKEQGCVLSSECKSDKVLRVYGDGKLNVLKIIKADISFRDKRVHHEVCVVDSEKGANLLSQATSIELGLLEIRGNFLSVDDSGEPPIGKLKNVQVVIKLDPNIPPVQPSCRHLPIPLKALVDEKLADLLKQDIIEPAPLNISWASPLVVTPKNGGRTARLCVDMRRANKAIIPEMHPLPTFEEIMPHLEGCKVFSKIDLVKAFHQIELSPESRDITTFVTQDASKEC